MDINFHYFAVKTLARYAGFPETEAQRIATYSEYIDDFDWITYLDCKNIPDYIKNDPNCDLHVPSITTGLANFNPAMTGFLGYVDMAFLLLERSQKFTVSPFHFTPRTAAGITGSTRTTPAIVGDGSLISGRLIEAREALQNRTEPHADSLMRIGMYLHTFADTYAHQLFSGYKSWANEIKVTQVTENATGKDITAEVALSSIITPPAIGHALANHTPDLTYVSFTMTYKRDQNDSAYSLTHSRSNTTEFLTASRHILNYLLSCQGLGQISEDDWEVLQAKMAKIFLLKYDSQTTNSQFAVNWNKEFPDYNYHFDKKAVEAGFYMSDSVLEATGAVTAKHVPTQDFPQVNSFLGTNYTEEFYRYNYIADQVLYRMYGAKPRKSWWN